MSANLYVYGFRVTRNKLKLDIIIVLSATLISKLISLLILGYPARTLGPESFGVAVTALSITAYAGIIIWPGVSNWGSMEIARNPERADEIISGVLFSRLLLAIIAVLFTSIGIYFSSFTSIEKYAIFAALLILFSLAINCEWVFYGKEAPKYPALVALVISIINVVLIFNLIENSLDVIIFVLIAPTTTMLASLTLLFALRKINVRLTLPSIPTCIHIFRESRHLGFAGAGIILLQYANNLIVRGNLDATAVGIFGASFYLFQVTMLVPVTLNSIFMGRVARVSSKSKDQISFETGKIFELYLIVGLLFGFTIYASAPILIEKLYGQSYAESSQLLKIMSFGILFNFGITAMSGFLGALQEDKAVLITVIVSLFMSIVGGMLLVPFFGLIGAAFTFAVIDATGLLVAILYFRRRVPEFHFNHYGYLFVATLIVIALFEFLPQTVSEPEKIIFCIALHFLLISGRSYKCLTQLFSFK